MTPETFAQHFHIFADAPNGVHKLREMILQLAVKGRLVPQDNNDEPASVLLEKIKEEKEKLIKEGRIKKQNPLLPIDLKEVPYRLPKGWEWVRLGDTVLSIVGGGTPSKRNPEFWNGKIPWASVKDLGNKKYLDSTRDTITLKGVENSSTNIISKGRIIVCTRMGLGKIVIAKISTAINQDLKAIDLSTRIDVDYFYTFYLTLKIEGAGMTVAGIKQDELLAFFFPLPPLAEQKRIVARVGQLMALCDELETRQKKRNESRITVNSACLNALTSPDVDSVEKAWQRISGNFDLLYECPENVTTLRQAILQLAVQGKLVPQNPKDEPASALLKRIAAKKEKLIQEGKLRHQNPLPPIDPKEMPYELPLSWVWVRLGEVTNYGVADKVEPGGVADGTWTLELEDIEKTTSRLLVRVRYPKREFKSTKNAFVEGSVLYGKLRPYLDKVLVADEPGVCSTEIIPLQSYGGINAPYLRVALKSPDFIAYANSSTHGMNLPRLGTEKARLATFPLPPLAEQKRIVAKVDQIMALCDELEAKLKQSQSGAETLTGAVANALTAA